MSHRVFITGVGLISAIGDTPEENWQSLVEGKSGIGTAKYVDSKLTDRFVFGEVPHSNEELKQIAGLPSDANFARTSLLAFIAAGEALLQAGLTSSEIDGIIMGCTVSSMCETQKLYENAQGIDNGSMLYDRYDIGSVAMEVSEYLGHIPYHNTINTACSSSANAIMQGVMMIRSGRAKRVLVGGADALSKYTINGFNSMMLLSEQRCSPFSGNRDGINLGEGAGFLVLEGEESIASKPVLAEVEGFGNANDSYHATSTSPEATGPTSAMQKALRTAGISSKEVQYINAHGTGTENNDKTEFQAIRKVFDKQIPLYASTKAYTGHTLGAAGSIETIFSLLMLRHQTVIGGNYTLTHDDKISILPLEASKKMPLRRVMSNAFGFGGNCTSLILKAGRE